VDPKRRLAYQALVQTTFARGGTFLCGGTIVNKRYIITAAHCIRHERDFLTNVEVMIGELNYCDGVTNEGGSWIPVNIPVGVNIHPNYEPGTQWQGPNNDIAVLELSEDITFTANIKPACLPTSATKDYSNLEATISGWGGTIAWSGNQPLQPQQCKLKESVVKVLSPTSSRCRNFIGSSQPAQLWPTSQLCAWAQGTGTCQGDSGGPLTVAENGKFTLIGVTSYGRGCLANTPGVYARVQGFLPWIKSLIADGECSRGDGNKTGGAKRGSIQSDNYPRYYPVNQDKTYPIRASPGKKIKMTFAAFSLENARSCKYDYLTIEDGNGKELLGKSCGQKPATLISETNMVNVIFHSDHSETSTGFKIDWIAV